MSLVDVETGEVVSSLPALEVIIERGIKSFVEVGEALLLIRDERLYREDHDTFEDYCRERWNFSRIHAHRFIDAAQVVGLLPIGNSAPANEAQARPLAALKHRPERMAEAWQAASVDHKPTAERVAQEVAKVIEREQDLAEGRQVIRDLNAKYQPPGFDAKENSDIVRQRGEFIRLCSDLAALPAPSMFVSRHIHVFQGPRRDEFLTAAGNACNWLNGLLNSLENQ